MEIAISTPNKEKRALPEKLLMEPALRTEAESLLLLVEASIRAAEQPLRLDESSSLTHATNGVTSTETDFGNELTRVQSLTGSALLTGVKDIQTAFRAFAEATAAKALSEIKLPTEKRSLLSGVSEVSLASEGIKLSGCTVRVFPSSSGAVTEIVQSIRAANSLAKTRTLNLTLPLCCLFRGLTHCVYVTALAAPSAQPSIPFLDTLLPAPGAVRECALECAAAMRASEACASALLVSSSLWNHLTPTLQAVRTLLPPLGGGYGRLRVRRELLSECAAKDEEPLSEAALRVLKAQAVPLVVATLLQKITAVASAFGWHPGSTVAVDEEALGAKCRAELAEKLPLCPLMHQKGVNIALLGEVWSQALQLTDSFLTQQIHRIVLEEMVVRACKQLVEQLADHKSADQDEIAKAKQFLLRLSSTASPEGDSFWEETLPITINSKFKASVQSSHLRAVRLSQTSLPTSDPLSLTARVYEALSLNSNGLRCDWIDHSLALPSSPERRGSVNSPRDRVRSPVNSPRPSVNSPRLSVGSPRPSILDSLPQTPTQQLSAALAVIRQCTSEANAAHLAASAYAKGQIQVDRVESLLISDEDSIDKELQVLARCRIGWFFSTFGEHAKAAERFKKALGDLESLSEPQQTLPTAVRSFLRLKLNASIAEQLLEDGKETEGKEYIQHTVALSAALRGEDTTEHAADLAYLASLLFRLCPVELASPLADKAHAIQLTVLGDPHPAIAASLLLRAEIKEAQGGLAEAEELINKAAAMLRASMGPKGRPLAVAINALALLHMEQKDYEKASKAFEEAIECLPIAQLSKDLVILLTNLGCALLLCGKHKEAEAKLATACSLVAEMAGPAGDDELASGVYGCMAAALAIQMRWLECEAQLGRAVSLWEGLAAVPNRLSGEEKEFSEAWSHALEGVQAIIEKERQVAGTEATPDSSADEEYAELVEGVQGDTLSALTVLELTADTEGFMLPRIAPVVPEDPEPVEEPLFMPISRVQLGPSLEAGEFGMVHSGTVGGRDVTIKVMEYRFRRPEQREALAQLVKKERAVSHENVSATVGVTIEPRSNLAWVIWERLPGGSLQEMFRTTVTPPWWKHRTSLQIARAIEYIHSEGLTHLCLRPSYVMLDSSFNAKVQFPELALTAPYRDIECLHDQQTGRPTGNPFMSPEQLSGQLASRASDAYSFAMTIYAIWKGSSPFGGTLGKDVAVAVIKGKRRPPVEDLPEGYRALIERCWNIDPAARPSFSEIVGVLSALPMPTAPAEDSEIPASWPLQRAGSRDNVRKLSPSQSFAASDSASEPPSSSRTSPGPRGLSLNLGDLSERKQSLVRVREPGSPRAVLCRVQVGKSPSPWDNPAAETLPVPSAVVRPQSARTHASPRDHKPRPRPSSPDMIRHSARGPSAFHRPSLLAYMPNPPSE